MKRLDWAEKQLSQVVAASQRTEEEHVAHITGVISALYEAGALTVKLFPALTAALIEAGLPINSESESESEDFPTNEQS